MWHEGLCICICRSFGVLISKKKRERFQIVGEVAWNLVSVESCGEFRAFWAQWREHCRRPKRSAS